MKRLLAFSAVVAACGPQNAQRGIEPTIEPGGDPGRDDSEFVLSRDPKTATALRADFPIHIEDKWWPFRAEYLDISIAEAKTRDQSISDRSPPAGFWDEQTAIEAVSIWTALCNECHGGRRKLRDAIEMPPPPPSWGTGNGLFFGKSRPYVEIFRTIYNGGPERDGKPSEMPAWGQRMSREQIWSLIYFTWYQSGRVVGQFPPSLYPRPPEGLQ